MNALYNRLHKNPAGFFEGYHIPEVLIVSLRGRMTKQSHYKSEITTHSASDGLLVMTETKLRLGYPTKNPTGKTRR